MGTLAETLVALTQQPGIEAERFTTGIQAAPPAGSYVGVAAGADATRQVVTTDLVSLNLLGDGSDTDSSWYQGAYLWLPDQSIQRRVALDGYNPSAEAASATDQALSTEMVAVLTATRKIRDTVVAASTAAELHGPLPPMYDADRKTSLRSWLNRALKVMRIPRRISLTGVANSYRYPLSAYPWIRHEGDLIRVSDREYLSDQDPYVLPGHSRIRIDGSVAYLILETPIASGATFYADIYAPAFTWIAVTGKATATATAGAITSIAVTRGGTYTTAPTVTIGGAGTGATAHAVLTNGTVTSIVVDTPGSGYVTATTTVTLSAGEYAASTVGLVNTDDRFSPLLPVDDVAAVAYAHVCDELAYRQGQGIDTAWTLRRARVADAVAPYLAWGLPEGPQVRATDRGAWGDHPQFLRRRESGGSRRWG